MEKQYALNLASDGRVLSATYQKYASYNSVIVNKLPEGNIYEYKYINGEYLYDPIQVDSAIEQPSQLDRIEAQIAYTAMMTDTLLEE